MLASHVTQPLLARIKAWETIISRAHGCAWRRLPARSLLCTAASKSPSFEDVTERKTQKQAYFKGKAAKPSNDTPKRTPSTTKTAESQPGDLQRLAKVMAAAGVASRRACEDLIDKGEVKVNGKVVQQQGSLVNPEKDSISVSGKKISAAQPRLYYFMVNKPKGYVCSNVDVKEGRGKRAVDLLNPWLEEWTKRQEGKDKKNVLPPRFFTVGRLDVSSYGLLLLTNDGHWAQKVIHPSAELTKEYIVMVDKAVKPSHLEKMMAGAEVDGVHVTPQEVSVVEESAKMRVVIAEGKKHEVRILVANAGLEVLSLKRVRIGGLRVPPSLGLGGYKQMTSREIKAVTDVSLQQQLTKNAWTSASMLLVNEKASGVNEKAGRVNEKASRVNEKAGRDPEGSRGAPSFGKSRRNTRVAA